MIPTKTQVFPAPVPGKYFQLEDFEAIFGNGRDANGHGRVPNFEPIEPKDIIGVLSINGSGGISGHCLVGDNTQHKSWCTYWLHTTQGGRFDGTGIVLGYPNLCGRFALCKHEVELLPTANPHRGIHDQYCTKCGMDLSYDSSD